MNCIVKALAVGDKNAGASLWELLVVLEHQFIAPHPIERQVDMLLVSAAKLLRTTLLPVSHTLLSSISGLYRDPH